MIDKLEMFIALAQARHFGRAAEAMGVTQPSLSAAVKSLEEELGVMLVLRGSRYGGLTPEGKRVLDWARRIVGDARTMKQELRAARHGLAGNVRLAVVPTALTVAAQLTTSFVRAHPDVHFTILSATSADILQSLEDLQIDAGISYLDNEPLGRVVTVPLYAERYALILRADAPMAGAGAVRWADLGALPLCLLTPDMQNRRIIGGHLAEAGVSVTPAIETNSTIVLIAHVLAGGHATILPSRAAEIFLADPQLRALPITEPDATHAIGLIAPLREPHTPVIAALLQEARRMAGD